MRKLATIRQIKKITPIEGADVDVVQVDEYKCIVPKDAYQTDDVVLFFKNNSALPDDDDRYEFLRKSSYKCWHREDGTFVDSCMYVHPMHVHGVRTQGLVMHVTDFPELRYASIPLGILVYIGQDLTDRLNIRYYPDVEKEARMRASMKGEHTNG